jgi:2-succinyl-5-enolpyruvyl-6-hydroxy-3-cyclohexene-1-carboxylate synthase
MWTDQYPSNLKIVVLNNKGGQIFNWIDGPKNEPKLMPFIETPQQYDFSKICEFYKVKHKSLAVFDTDIFQTFINGNIQCLEIVSNSN